MMLGWIRKLHRFRKADQGQAVVEFAVFTSMFVVIMIGATDLSLNLIACMAAQECATEGAAYGASPGNQLDTTNMVAWAEQAAYGASLASTPVATTFFTCTPGGTVVTSSTICPGGGAPLEYVKVTAVANVNPLFKSTFVRGGTANSTAIFRVAWKTQ
jgi:hypothetical protein